MLRRVYLLYPGSLTMVLRVVRATHKSGDRDPSWDPVAHTTDALAPTNALPQQLKALTTV